MRAVADRFHDRMELEAGESFKAFLFAVKALAAMGFLFVFGHVSATGELPQTAVVILGLAAVLDLAPEIVTLRMLGALSERARRAEQLQLVLKAAAYTVLIGVLAGAAPSALWGYAAFTVLWLASFIVEEAVMFLLEPADS